MIQFLCVRVCVCACALQDAQQRARKGDAETKVVRQSVADLHEAVVYEVHSCQECHACWTCNICLLGQAWGGTARASSLCIGTSRN